MIFTLFLGLKLKNFIYHKLTDKIIAVITFISFLMIVIICSIIDNTNSNQKDDIYPESFEIIFNIEIYLIIIPVIEMILKLIADRKLYFQSINQSFNQFYFIIAKEFKRQKFNYFELSTSLATVILLILNVYANVNISDRLLTYMILFRVGRILRFIIHLKYLNYLFKIFFDFAPYFMKLMAILMIIYNIFTLIGIELFGGYLRTNIIYDFQQYGDPNNYVYDNFNDFAMGMTACFHLTVVNNWLYTVITKRLSLLF